MTWRGEHYEVGTRFRRPGPTLRFAVAMNSPLARSRTRFSLIGVLLKLEVVDILGERQLGDRELISDLNARASPISPP